MDGLVDLKVPGGTQPGTTLVMSKRGVPRLGVSDSRGDHQVPRSCYHQSRHLHTLHGMDLVSTAVVWKHRALTLALTWVHQCESAFFVRSFSRSLKHLKDPQLKSVCCKILNASCYIACLLSHGTLAIDLATLFCCRSMSELKYQASCRMMNARLWRS